MQGQSHRPSQSPAIRRNEITWYFVSYNPRQSDTNEQVKIEPITHDIMSYTLICNHGTEGKQERLRESA